jgi:hypothetical protein
MIGRGRPSHLEVVRLGLRTSLIDLPHPSPSVAPAVRPACSCSTACPAAAPIAALDPALRVCLAAPSRARPARRCRRTPLAQGEASGPSVETLWPRLLLRLRRDADDGGERIGMLCMLQADILNVLDVLEVCCMCFMRMLQV